MRVLLDTHTLLWATLSMASLSPAASVVVGDEANTIFVSAVSALEIATKVRIGKLAHAEELERDFVRAVEAAGYTFLSVDAACALRAGRLVGEHRDPFDRLIAAQALAADMAVVSNDSKLDLFGVRRIW